MPTSRIRRVGPRASATERFHEESRKKRLPPLVTLLGLILAGLLVAIGVILFGGEKRLDVIIQKIELKEQEAARRESAGDLAGALAMYREALELARPHGELRWRAARLRSTIKELDSRLSARVAALEEIGGFLENAGKATEETADDLHHEGMNLQRKYGASGFEILVRLKEEIARLRKLIPKKDVHPSVVRSQIRKICRLDARRKTGLYGMALRMWKDYLDSTGNPGYRLTARSYIEALRGQIREAAHEVRRRAERLAEGGGREGALELLARERPRFEGTPSVVSLDAKIRELKAER